MIQKIRLSLWWTVIIDTKIVENFLSYLNRYFPFGEEFRAKNIRRVKKTLDSGIAKVIICPICKYNKKQIVEKMKIDVNKICVDYIPQISDSRIRDQDEFCHKIWPLIRYKKNYEAENKLEFIEFLNNLFRSSILIDSVSSFYIDHSEKIVILRQNFCKNIATPHLHSVIKLLKQISPDSTYLFTDFVIVLENEPCLMCSMALMHSRFRFVCFELLNSELGSLYSNVKLQNVKGLNHHQKIGIIVYDQ